MTDTNSRSGRVAVLGGGPAGMATALSVHQAGHDVVIFERYAEARPAGNILNLWPPPLRTNQSVERIERGDRHMTLRFADGSAQEADVLIGADGINSLARRTLWGDTPIREHRLHVIGGSTFADDTGAEPGMAILSTTRLGSCSRSATLSSTTPPSCRRWPGTQTQARSTSNSPSSLTERVA